MKRMKLTLAGRVVVFALIAAIVCGCGFVGYKYFAPADLIDNFGSDSLGNYTDGDKNDQPAKPNVDVSDATINLSLDEWIGWEPVLYANQGLTTQPGSIFDKLGIRVNIHIINDAEASSNALIKGDLNAAGYTLNRTALLEASASLMI